MTEWQMQCKKMNGWTVFTWTLKEPFDRVPRDRLIWKLQYKGGINENLLKGLENFFKERKMRILRENSHPERIGGVSQGAVVASIMILVYRNDNIGTGSYMNMLLMMQK